MLECDISIELQQFFCKRPFNLEEDHKRPKAQRCSARRLHERLEGRGYTGAYESVQRFVKQWQLLLLRC